jgi:hypothetical protein
MHLNRMVGVGRRLRAGDYVQQIMEVDVDVSQDLDLAGLQPVS